MDLAASENAAVDRGLGEIQRPRLKPGARLAVISPASAAKAELVQRGIETMRAFGYDPVLMPHALARGPLYYAGTAEERVADLHAAFADPAIDGIVCTRGGWGSAELLPLLDRALIRAHPKPFIGYSDHSSLQTWLWNECRMQSFYAPMVAADWAQPGGVDEASWRAALTPSKGTKHSYTLGAGDGMQALREGEAEGRLLGGCLAILEAGLGTPWAIRIDEPCILFLEDIHVRPYHWDRMLQHLRFAGVLQNVTGIVFGDAGANVETGETDLLHGAYRHALRDFGGPVAMGLRCGHVTPGNRSLLLGAFAELRCGDEATLRVATTTQGESDLVEIRAGTSSETSAGTAEERKQA